jgi:hypothetical protein
MRMFLGDMSGPVCNMPGGATESTQVTSNSAAPAVERRNKTPIYVSGITETCSFLTWLRASCQSGPSAQVKGENQMLVA